MVKRFSLAFVIVDILLYFTLVCISSVTWAKDEPELPIGLDDSMETTEPELPLGLDTETQPPRKTSDTTFSFETPSEISGFWELKTGLRLQEDPYEKDFSLGETRLQLETQRSFNEFLGSFTADFIYDPVFDHHSVDLEEGEGLLDLREANIIFSPIDSMDVKFGRQILTWGIGDMLFVNDLFRSIAFDQPCYIL